MIEPIYITLGATIRSLRKAHDMTQEQLADALGMLRSSLTQIENGNRRLHIHELLILSKLFDMPVIMLLPCDIKEEQEKLGKSEALEWQGKLDQEWREYAR